MNDVMKEAAAAAVSPSQDSPVAKTFLIVPLFMLVSDEVLVLLLRYLKSTGHFTSVPIEETTFPGLSDIMCVHSDIHFSSGVLPLTGSHCAKSSYFCLH